MLSISARLRPMRSATKPKSRPPMPEATSVSVLSSPACFCVMPRSRITCTSTSEYSITSKASSIQPSAAATSVRRWSRVEVEKVTGSGAVDIAPDYKRRLPRAAGREQPEVPARAHHVAADLLAQCVHGWELDLFPQPPQEADLHAGVREHFDGMEVQQ